MSLLTTIYDNIVTEVQGLLTTHTRLPNPYTIERNPEPMLNKGWGIRLGPQTNTRRQLCNTLSAERDITIVITRKFYAQDLNTTGKASVEKLLLEDQRLVMNEYEKEPQVNATQGVIKFWYESDNGIEFVFLNEEGNYLKIESLFKMEYLEEGI